jgi:hypothetical protein
VKRNSGAWDCQVTPVHCGCQERNTIGCIPSNDGLDARWGTGFPHRRRRYTQSRFLMQCPSVWKQRHELHFQPFLPDEVTRGRAPRPWSAGRLSVAPPAYGRRNVFFEDQLSHIMASSAPVRANCAGRSDLRRAREISYGLTRRFAGDRSRSFRDSSLSRCIDSTAKVSRFRGLLWGKSESADKDAEWGRRSKDIGT